MLIVMLWRVVLNPGSKCQWQRCLGKVNGYLRLGGLGVAVHTQGTWAHVLRGPAKPTMPVVQLMLALRIASRIARRIAGCAVFQWQLAMFVANAANAKGTWLVGMFGLRVGALVWMGKLDVQTHCVVLRSWRVIYSGHKFILCFWPFANCSFLNAWWAWWLGCEF